MTTKQFRDAFGTDLSRMCATECGYTVDTWRRSVHQDWNIDDARLACMLQAAEAHAKQITAAVKAARKARAMRAEATP